MIEDDDKVKEYLPDYSDKHVPDKTYLCNIVNTVHKNSILKWIKKLKEKKIEEKQKQKDHYILIDNATYNDLEAFQSIYGDEKIKRNRLAGLLCESRKKEKGKRSAKFVLDYEVKKFSEISD